MLSLNSAANAKFAIYGQYAQAHAGTDFDGSQLMQVWDDLKASGASESLEVLYSFMLTTTSVFNPAYAAHSVPVSLLIFALSVMPQGSWQGLTPDDNSQAVNICNVRKSLAVRKPT